MAYIIIGMFPEHQQAYDASKSLEKHGFSSEDVHISKFSRKNQISENDYSVDDHPHFKYHEEEKTTGFWNWLFGDDEHTKRKYSYAATKNNIVTVFAEDLSQAESAREILNDAGAINVHDESKVFLKNQKALPNPSTEIDPREQARIINKAKNNLYFTGERRYEIQNHDKGMRDDMDSQGHSTEPF